MYTYKNVYTHIHVYIVIYIYIIFHDTSARAFFRVFKQRNTQTQYQQYGKSTLSIIQREKYANTLISKVYMYMLYICIYVYVYMYMYMYMFSPHPCQLDTYTSTKEHFFDYYKERTTPIKWIRMYESFCAYQCWQEHSVS